MQTFRSRWARAGGAAAAALLGVAGLSVMGVLPAGAFPTAPPTAVTATLAQGASSAIASDGSASVTWTDSGDSSTQYYLVQALQVAQFLGGLTTSPPVPLLGTPLQVLPGVGKATITGLVAYDTYVITVTACNGDAVPCDPAGSDTGTSAPVTVTVGQNYSFAGPTGFAQQQLAGAAAAPPLAGSGSTFHDVFPGGGQVVPITDSGVGLNYIFGTTQYYQLPTSTTGPGGATVLSAVAAGNLTWSGGQCVNVLPLPHPPTPTSCNQSPPVSAVPASGSAPISVTICVSATVAIPPTGLCDASPNLPLDNSGGTFGGFDGPGPIYPYLEVSTGSTQIPHGATLTLPNVVLTMKATGQVGTNIDVSQFEFATSANISLGGGTTIPVVGWPSKSLYSTSTTPPCNGIAPVSGSCPAVTSLPLNAVDSTGGAPGALDSGLEYGGAPYLLARTAIGPPTPFIQVTGGPFNALAGGVSIPVTGANWPTNEGPIGPTAPNGLSWSACPTGAPCDDRGSFSVSGGNLTGTINFGPDEQLSTSTSPITVTLTATDGTTTATTQVTVNPFQSFQTACFFGNGAAVPPLSNAQGNCTINQLIQAPVVGTSLFISETENPTGQTPPASKVLLSQVTLGLGTGTNNTNFANATGALNSVSVSDDRGTLGGWDVTGQLTDDFHNVGTNYGPTADNVIPADNLTWVPSVELATPGGLPGNNANTINCPAATGPCTGPSGAIGGNGTLGAVASTSTPAEVSAGGAAVLNNMQGSAKELCGTNQAAGGGGGFICNATLSLAIPPYVSEGTYQDTLNLLVVGY